MKRSASVERIENDNAVLKRAHMQSVREHILELRAAQLASSESAAGSGSVDSIDSVDSIGSVDSVTSVETEASGLLCRATDRAAAEQAWERADAGSSGCAATKEAMGGGGSGGDGCSDGGGGDGGGGYSGVSPPRPGRAASTIP